MSPKMWFFFLMLCRCSFCHISIFTTLTLENSLSKGIHTWSSWFVCLTRYRRKSNLEHLRTRMRSAEPSAKWAAGERPFGLRGQAQLIFTALMARNFPLITFHSSSSSETHQQRHGDRLLFDLLTRTLKSNHSWQLKSFYWAYSCIVNTYLK